MVIRNRWARLAVAAALVSCLGAEDVRAGGDDLYGDTEGHLPQFIGIARDIKSFKPMAGVRIVATRKGSGQFFTTSTDAEGRFRIEGFPEGFDPNSIEFTCTKAGYKQVNVIRRKVSSAADAPTEIECLSQPA
jgi:hypothetical protein